MRRDAVTASSRRQGVVSVRSSPDRGAREIQGGGRSNRTSRSAGPQPEKRGPGHSPPSAHRRLRCQWQRQDQPSARHLVRGRPTPLHGKLFHLHAAVPRPVGKAGRRPDRWLASRDRCHARRHDPLAAGHGRDRHGDRRLPAAGLRPRRPRSLPRLRCGSPRPFGRTDRRTLGGPAGQAASDDRLPGVV